MMAYALIGHQIKVITLEAKEGCIFCRASMQAGEPALVVQFIDQQAEPEDDVVEEYICHACAHRYVQKERQAVTVGLGYLEHEHAEWRSESDVVITEKH